MAKSKSLEQCKTPKEIEQFVLENGMQLKRVTGGHAMFGNERGTFPLSTHAKELPKGTLHAIKKQIKVLLAISSIIFLLVYVAPMLT